MRRTLRHSGKTGAGLLLAGLLLLFSVRLLNDRDDWIVLSTELPTSSAESRAQVFSARSDGFVEIQIEVAGSVDPTLLDAYINPINSPSALDVRWQVRDGAGVVAAGDARDYLYLENQPSLLGRLRRIVMQVPFGRDETHWNSLGLAGSRTVARGVGRFSIEAGKRYAVDAMASGDLRDLGELAPILVLRVERRAWQAHYRRVRSLGYLGLASIFIGFLLVLASRLHR